MSNEEDLQAATEKMNAYQRVRRMRSEYLELKSRLEISSEDELQRLAGLDLPRFAPLPLL
jgi:hypothetical protein